MEEYVSSEGKNCIKCGQPLDTITTKTMLCKKCKGVEWSKHNRAKFKEKYGIDNPMQDPKIVAKIQNTMLERYGAKCAMEVPEFRNKFIKTCTEKYGTAYYVNSPEFVNKSSCKSKINDKFKDLLEANGIYAQAEKRYDDKRFDFQVKGKNILIEIDPSYTHNSAGNHWDTEGNDSNQQIVKTLIAEKYGYRCIHVFDWDDWNDIIDLIRPTSSVYARKCILKQIEKHEYDPFINENHIQKNCKGTKIALGLFYHNELVQVMTFGKPRYNKNYQWELLRLCTKKGLTIVGGASKLFKHATNVLKLTSIISYCDRSKFSGNIYSTIGMTLLRETEPQETWSKGSDRITSSLLRQRGFDQLFNTNYGKGTSNEKLMLEHGWLPVFDCGQKVFVFGEPISNEQVDQPKNNTNYNELLKSIDKKKEKICEFCGEPFVPRSNFQRYCKRPHYMNCPVCGKRYLVTNNENLKRPPVACSYECRAKKTRETSLKKYGVVAPGNNAEAREKAKQTMQEKYGIDYAMQSAEIYQKGVETIQEKYGVKNIQQVSSITNQAHQTRKDNWIDQFHELLPLKIFNLDQQSGTVTNLEDDSLTMYILTEKAAVEFLTQYGIRPKHVFKHAHLSLGLVSNKVIYQVVRFEKLNDSIVLSNFGTRLGYFNPNYYHKLLQFATAVYGIEEFDAIIPRGLATSGLIESMQLEKISEGDYEAYWKTESDEYIKVNQQDNLVEMSKDNEYITTDYLDRYRFKGWTVQPNQNIEFITQQEQLS